ncbi:MAG: hypothetical protein V2A65_06590 [Candidatus Omnitrophota bacterium]
MWALIGGIVAVLLGALLAGPGPLGKAALWFVGGGIVVMLVLGGLVAIASGISDIKDRLSEKKEKEETPKVADKKPE